MTQIELVESINTLNEKYNDTFSKVGLTVSKIFETMSEYSLLLDKTKEEPTDSEIGTELEEQYNDFEQYVLEYAGAVSKYYTPKYKTLMSLCNRLYSAKQLDESSLGEVVNAAIEYMNKNKITATDVRCLMSYTHWGSSDWDKYKDVIRAKYGKI